MGMPGFGRTWILSTVAAAAWCAAGCGAATRAPVEAPAAERPGRSVHDTLRSAIGLLERYQCGTFAVAFLSPIKVAQIADLDAYRQRRQCGPDDRGNLDDVLMAMRLALGAEPEVSGVKATIDLSGIGLHVTKLEFVRYIDGLWYFNEL